MTNKIAVVRHGDENTPEEQLNSTVALIVDNKVMAMDEDKNEVSPAIAQTLDPTITLYEFHELDLPPNWGSEELLNLVAKKDALNSNSYKQNLGLFVSNRCNVDYIESPTGLVMAIRDDGRSITAALYDSTYDAYMDRGFLTVMHDFTMDKSIDTLPGFNNIAAINASGDESDTKSIALTMQLASGESIGLHDSEISMVATHVPGDAPVELTRAEVLKLIAMTERFMNYRDKQPEQYEMGIYRLKVDAAKYLPREDQSKLLGDNINPYAVLHNLIELESRNYYYGDEKALFMSNGAPVYSPYICEDKMFGVDPHEHYTDGYHQFLIDIEKSNGNTLTPDLASFETIDFNYDSKDNQVKYKDQTVLAGLIDIKDEGGVTVFKEMVAYNETRESLITDGTLSRMNNLAGKSISEDIELLITDESRDSPQSR